jgi:hypothetical protein
LVIVSVVLLGVVWLIVAVPNKLKCISDSNFDENRIRIGSLSKGATTFGIMTLGTNDPKHDATGHYAGCCVFIAVLIAILLCVVTLKLLGPKFKTFLEL